jgi:hypothetical protein
MQKKIMKIDTLFHGLLRKRVIRGDPWSIKQKKNYTAKLLIKQFYNQFQTEHKFDFVLTDNKNAEITLTSLSLK